MKTGLVFRYNYEGMTDREIIGLVTNPPEGQSPNGEAVAYLLYERYAPLLKKIHRKVFGNKDEFYGDCVDDLYNYLYGGEPAWRKLINFEWRSSFGTWLRPTAYNRFVERKSFLIGKNEKMVSIDDDSPDRPKVQVADKGAEAYEGKETRALVIESIGRLRNADQRFAVIKQLEGYESKEIAELLKEKWASLGIVKYGYVKVEGQDKREKKIVVPTEKYVDSLLQHTRTELKRILVQLSNKEL